jgi:hypothetical protein
MNATASCAAEFSNFMSALAGLMTVLGIQAAASFAAAGIAWMPWAGQAPMWVILGALVVQLALIPSLIAFFEALVRCAQATVAAATRPVPLPLIAAFVGICLVTAVSYVYLSRGKKLIAKS